MSKVKQFGRSASVNLRPLELAFLAFYDEKYGIAERGEVIRSLINGYVNADKRFAAKEFLAYVEKTMAKEETDAVIAGELVRQARQYAEERLSADAPTATMTGKKK